MSLCNVEVFTKDYVFRCSFLGLQKKYKVDYISLEYNILETQCAQAEKGDYIRIFVRGKIIFGVLEEIKKKNGAQELKYKPLMSLFDVNVYCQKERLKEMTLEHWIGDIIRNLYCNNEDDLQNITGFRVAITSETVGATLDMEKNIANLYQDILIPALIQYRIIIDVSMDVMEKELLVTIGQNTDPLYYIEADLPNVIRAELISKKTKSVINKLLIYNDKNEEQSEIYYLTSSEEITKNPEQNERISPVVQDVVFISYQQKKDESFTEAAYQKAFSQLSKGKYDNLIELTVYYQDMLLKPERLKIGMEAEIRMKGEIYKSILTGKEEEEKQVTLMFGCIRIELTKILKARNGNGQY